MWILKKIGTFLVTLVFVFTSFFSFGFLENSGLLVKATGEPIMGNVAIISNESTNITTASSTGNFSVEYNTPTIDNNFNLELYKMDYVKPLNENILTDTTNTIKQNMMISFVLYNVGDTKTFHTYNILTGYYNLITATLKSSGIKSNVWVNISDYNMSTVDADKITAEFDNNISLKITSVFGQPSDIDNNSKINILCFDIKDGFSGSGGYVAGYFDPSDLYRNNTYNPYSNQMEVFYIDIYPGMGTGTTKDVTQCFDTIAHEFQHMINFNQNVFVENNPAGDMDTWLNEAFSEAASQVYSEQISTNRIDIYNSDNYNLIKNGLSLLDWQGELENYSLSYLFSQYLKEQVGIGDDVFSEVMQSNLNACSAVEAVIQAHINPNLDFGQFMSNFRAALVLKNSTGPYGFKGNIGFNSIEPKIYTGSATNLVGGGAIVIAVNNSITIPSNKGADVEYLVFQKSAPVISGITNNSTYKIATLRFSDGTAKLNGTTRDNGAIITIDGSYNLVVTDLLGHSSTVYFTINHNVIGNLTGINPNTIITNLKSCIIKYSNQTAEIYNKNNQPITNNNYVVGTAMYLKIFQNSTLIKTYRLIIYGDVTGDGVIGLNDLTSIRDDLLENTQLVDEFRTAGDLYGEGKITLNDLVGVMSYISENGSIRQS